MTAMRIVQVADYPVDYCLLLSCTQFRECGIQTQNKVDIFWIVLMREETSINPKLTNDSSFGKFADYFVQAAHDDCAGRGLGESIDAQHPKPGSGAKVTADLKQRRILRF
jgi:hypothetical protein